MTSHGGPEGEGGSPLTEGGRQAAAEASKPLTTPHHGLPQIRWIEEIKRRNVGRIAILYGVACWLILEPVHVIFHMLQVPVWANRLVIILMTLGFPVVMIFAWVYEITPDGLKPTVEVPHGQSIRRQTGRRLDRAIIAVLALALVYFVIDKFWLSKHVVGSETALTVATRAHIPAPLPVQAKSIAVLPFVDLTDKQDQAYFADGMAEEVIDLLANIPGLTVIGRTSSFQFRGKAIDVRSIGQTLGVSYLLEGSVRRSADQIRVTAQLITTKDGSHRWSDTYDAKAGDVLKVQDAIAASLARALEIAVADVPAPRRSSVNLSAYDLYLRALHLLDADSKESCEEAVGTFQQVLELDPTHTAAEVGIASAYVLIGENGWMPPRVAFEHAREAATRALAMDPQNAAAHVALANVHAIYDWEWTQAEQEVNTALKSGVRDPLTLIVAARVATVQGKWDRATQLLRQAIAQDPLNPYALTVLGLFVQLRTGHFAEAETPLRRSLQISPRYGSGHFFLAIDLLMQGRFDEALVQANQETLDDGQLEASAAIYHALNRKRDSDAFLARAVERNADSWASAIAKVYAFRGERDKALEWLNRAYEQRDEDLYFIAGDPLLRNLERDPRYVAFLKKMNFPAP
jgi:TolB-like protein/Tfp pilus assembly protein PilF